MGVDAAGGSSSRESEAIRGHPPKVRPIRRRADGGFGFFAKLKRRLKRPPRQSEPIIIRPVIPCYFWETDLTSEA